ncbi:MAG: hypothetical protein QOI21_5668 [Actinomycetota bacterium]|jgi:hypothetical protein|nr:hypothetical protein [Actinomycetota bacterium]
MTRKVILVLTSLVAILVGAVVGLLLVAPGGRQQTAPTPTPVPSPTSSAPPADSAAVGVAQAIADAITEGDSLKFGLITCDRQNTGELQKLQQKWDAAGTVSAFVIRPPLVTGDRATVTIHVEGADGEKETEFPLQKKGEKWCVPG